jgi:hypothetical protein
MSRDRDHFRSQNTSKDWLVALEISTTAGYFHLKKRQYGRF